MGINYNVSLSGMTSAQKGIQVMQQNIANMNTEGYARQRIDLEQSGVSSGSGIMQKNGSGVNVKDIVMMTDQVLLNNYNGQNSKVGYFGNIEQALTEAETIYGDFTEGSLNKLGNKFFEAWEELSKFPEENSYKQALIGEAKRLVNKVNELGNEFARMRNATMSNAAMQIDEVNVLTENLANINKRFNELGNNAPNSLRNERDIVIEKLSNYMKIDVSYESTNKDVVSVRSEGSYLVDLEKSFELKIIDSADETFISNGKTRVDLGEGKLMANMDLATKYLKGYQDDIEQYAMFLKDSVNSYHTAGFNLEGDTGIDFFSGVSAKTLSINEDLILDANKIATSEVNGLAGNTSIAKKIAGVIAEEIEPGMSFRDHVNSLTMTMAQDLYDASAQTSINTEVLNGLKQQKESVQGVNMDEEMTNLMAFQNYYSANAKALKMTDEMFDVLFQII